MRRAHIYEEPQVTPIVLVGAAMNDLTLLYYTANRIDPGFAERVRFSLLEAVTARIVVVSQRPSWTQEAAFAEIDFYRLQFPFIRSCVAVEADPSIQQVYRNVLEAAKRAATPYVACCEDDSLYTAEHFAFRPPSDDTFYYNRSRWVLTRRLADDGKSRTAIFYWRERTQLAQLICHRQLLIETLEERFAKHPNPPTDTNIAKKAGWGEPGRYEKNLKLTPRKRAYFDTVQPNVTFNHSESLMGRRRVNPDDKICEDLPPWGNATELWRRIHG